MLMKLVAMQDRLPGGEETFWQTIVRAIIVKSLGEEQARQADTMPFQWKPATDIFSIYKVLRPALQTSARVQGSHSARHGSTSPA